MNRKIFLASLPGIFVLPPMIANEFVRIEDPDMGEIDEMIEQLIKSEYTKCEIETRGNQDHLIITAPFVRYETPISYGDAWRLLYDYPIGMSKFRIR